jgi:pimeloyl-ACP methyl ester carboxylesterase
MQKPLSFVLLLLHFWCYSSDDMQKYYSTTFLKNYDAVYQSLIEAGFQDISFKTPDNLKLSGLFLERPDATCNVIVCAGWLPGKKEGMATFYALLPEYCNILFFDARGRGTSEGPLVWNVWRYGMDEYKDILGAISWINNNNALPIIIGGTCAGVFNAAHAILDLIRNNRLTESHVQGLFFDSGWGSVMTMSRSSAIANIKKYIHKIIAAVHQTKRSIKNSVLYTTFCSIAVRCFRTAHFLCVKPLINQYEKTTNLFDKIQQITLPILFIHSYDDTHASFASANKLASLAPNKECWWIQKSSHAKHHLYHKDLYKEKLTAFINTVLD